VEHLDDKKILDGFIGMLLPWNSTWPRAMLKFQRHVIMGLRRVKLISRYEYREIPDFRFKFP